MNPAESASRDVTTFFKDPPKPKKASGGLRRKALNKGTRPKQEWSSDEDYTDDLIWCAGRDWVAWPLAALIAAVVRVDEVQPLTPASTGPATSTTPPTAERGPWLLPDGRRTGLRPMLPPLVDEAWDRVVARHPIPSSSRSQRSAWVAKHAGELRDEYRRLLAVHDGLLEPEPLQGVLL